MSDLKEWMNPLLSAENRVLIADGEIATLSAELAGAKKSRNAAMQLYESSREHRDHLLIKQREWQEALATLDSERAANALLTAQLAAAEARAERREGLSPIHAAETARHARAFLHAFVGQEFGEFAECGSHDRQYLGIALDYVEELSSMVLTLTEAEAG